MFGNLRASCASRTRLVGPHGNPQLHRMFLAQDSPNLTGPVGLHLNGISRSTRAAGNNNLPRPRLGADTIYPLHTICLRGGMSPRRPLNNAANSICKRRRGRPRTAPPAAPNKGRYRVSDGHAQTEYTGPEARTVEALFGHSQHAKLRTGVL